MNKQGGFIGIGTIISIVAGLVAAGAVIYYLESTSKLTEPYAEPLVQVNLEPESLDSTIPKLASDVKDCGISTSPSGVSSDPYNYNKDQVLACLGNAVLNNCENAKGIFKSNMYPTIFQIINDQNTCYFKLAYDQNSTTYANQFIQCPVSIINIIDEEASSKEVSRDKIIFKNPTKDNPNEYAAQIYAYGTSVVFFVNGYDQTRIKNTTEVP